MMNISTGTVSPNIPNAKGVNGQAIAQLLPLALLIIVANGLVLTLFSKRRELHTPPNYVLLSLAICDLMNGLVNIPLFIIVAFTPVITSGEVKFYLVYLVGVLHHLTAISACYHILAVTTEKYLAIIWPVRHRSIKVKKVAIVLIIIWLVSVIVAFIPFSWLHLEFRDIQAKFSLAHVALCLVAVFLLPYSFMIYAFVVIFKKISSPSKIKDNVSSRPHISRRQAAAEKRCLILFALMATFFLACWLPWFILTLFHRIKHDIKVDNLEIPSHVFVLVRYTSSIFNPLLYTFFRRDFKTALKSFLKKKTNEDFPMLPLFENKNT